MAARRGSFRVLAGGIGAALIAATLGLVVAGTPAVAAPSSSVVYDSTVNPLPGNMVSQAFEATQTSEFGNQVTLSGAANDLNNVVVTMSSWGCQTGSPANGFGNANACVTAQGATFSEPITLNIYNVGANNAVGSLLATDTQTFAIPYRPSSSDPTVPAAATAGCTEAGGQWYDSTDGKCYNGLATNITFNLAAQNVVLPSNVIYGIAYNTSDYGASPYGDDTACHATAAGCGYDSLNVALSQDPTNVSVGSDPNPGTVYWNTSTATDYCDGGAGGSGTFRIDGAADTSTCADGGAATGWAVSGTGSPYYVPAVQINATPAPSSTVVVTPADLVSSPTTTGQFVVTNESGQGGTVSIVSGPSGGPSADSLQLTTTGTSDHWDAFNYDHDGVPFSSLSTLSYTAITNNAPDFDPDFQLTANLGSGITFSTVNYEPYQQATPDTNNAWQSFNVLDGLVWATHIADTSPGGLDDPISWSSFLSLYPNATVEGVGVDVGSAWQPMVGNVGSLSIGTDGANGATTTYEFTTAARPSNTVVVTPPNLVTTGTPTTGQFLVTNESGGNGSVQIVTGPAGGPTADSLQLSTTGASDHWDAFNYDYDGVALSNINALSYSAITNSAPDYDPVFQLQADLSPSITFSTVNYEPYQQATPDTANTWQSFNVLTGLVWATHIVDTAPGGLDDPISWSSFVSLYPGATLIGLGADVGSAWPAMTGSVDALTIGTDGANGSTTTYDFANVAPQITTQPTNQTYTSGGSVTWTAAASGSPTPTVQWQYSTNHGTSWTNLSGATSTTLTASDQTSFENGWQVRAVFTNSAGTATSNGASETLNTATAPQITTQPTNQTFTSGGSVTWTAAASGSPTPTVQWQYSTNHGTSWTNLSGATSTTLTASDQTSFENGWQVRAVFTNSAGTATSNGASETLNTATAPQITTQPTNQTYTSGGSVTWTAGASGSPTPTVQWQYSTNHGTSWTNLSGATSTTLTASDQTSFENGWQVRAVFTNSAGTATSNGASETLTS